MMNPLASSEVLNIAIVKGAASQNGTSIYSWFHYRPNSTTVLFPSTQGKDKQSGRKAQGPEGEQGVSLARMPKKGLTPVP